MKWVSSERIYSSGDTLVLWRLSEFTDIKFDTADSQIRHEKAAR